MVAAQQHLDTVTENDEERPGALELVGSLIGD